MVRVSLASPTGLIRSAWTFCREHPALLTVLFWLLFLPQALRAILALGEPASPILLTAYKQWNLEEFLSILVSILLSIVIVWGEACILLIGKRMIQSKSGRKRTSFKAVRREAIPLIVPLLLTSLLQLCLTFYRALLFIVPALLMLLFLQRSNPVLASRPSTVLSLYPWSPLLLLLLLPAVIYYVRTFLYDVALVSEDVAYRDALRRSRELTEGKLLGVSVRLLFLTCVILLPSALLTTWLKMTTVHAAPVWIIGAGLLTSLVSSVSILLFVLGCVALYGSLRHMREGPRK